MCCNSGHAGAAVAIISLLLSTAFLVWVAEKSGNCYQKLGKAVGMIAFVLSALLIVGSLYACLDAQFGCRSKRGCPMLQGMGMGAGAAMMMQQRDGDHHGKGDKGADDGKGDDGNGHDK